MKRNMYAIEVTRKRASNGHVSVLLGSRFETRAEADQWISRIRNHPSHYFYDEICQPTYRTVLVQYGSTDICSNWEIGNE